MTYDEMETEFSEIDTILSKIRIRLDDLIEIRLREVEQYFEGISHTDRASRAGWRTVYERFFGR